MRKVLILNGPNLNLLGRREPGIYGSTSLDDLETILGSNVPKGMHLSFFQSNHEGKMIERIHQLMDIPVDGVVINPAAWTHTSLAIRDALIAVNIPLIEVHISNVHAREAFRRHSYVSDIALAVIAGCGIYGYAFALETLNQHLNT
tara:strand:- start:2294 stop:2731 length:438 start_codon:yes stop_codon:yes gene_type:complete